MALEERSGGAPAGTRLSAAAIEGGGGGSPDLSVTPEVLRSAATASEAARDGLLPVIERAVADMAAAAESMRAWSIGRRMAETGPGWGGAIGEEARRLGEHAVGLRMVADGTTAVDAGLDAQFRSWGTVG